MILFNGQLYSDAELAHVLAKLETCCLDTIEQRSSIVSDVIDACDALAEKIASGCYDDIILPLLSQGTFTRLQFEEAVSFFRREHLEYKYQTELGILTKNLTPIPGVSDVVIERSLAPLGILFHIAAGNAEGLPFYSVIEGLLTGNINLLKLPSADDGLSLLLLLELIKIRPLLAPYIAVFDFPSTDTGLLKTLAILADAIVIWGGDEAIRAARTLADPATQIISWGHKLSFAYITPDASEDELRKLAAHICATNQLLCSSCQGIFVDTDDISVVEAIGEKFLTLLDSEAANYPQNHIGIRGKVSISLYNEELESGSSGRKALRGNGVSVLVCNDSSLELSYMFRNCWIKPLPRTDIIKALKSYRGYLQTVGLICKESERHIFADILARTGVTRITYGFDMSRTVSGETHDGEYALRRYSHIIEKEVRTS